MSKVIQACRNVGKVNNKLTALYLCDMQDKFRDSIQYFNQIVHVSNRLLKSFKILSLPVVCTEQYPKGLGSTVPELEVREHGITPIPKTLFSMCSDATNKVLQENKIQSVVLCGIESHVCVQNTALDLLEQGFDVHVPVDAVSSRSMVDRMYSLERMKQSGAFLTTSESLILGLAGGAHHPEFRKLQKIIWEAAPDSGLLGMK